MLSQLRVRYAHLQATVVMVDNGTHTCTLYCRHTHAFSVASLGMQSSMSPGFLHVDCLRLMSLCSFVVQLLVVISLYCLNCMLHAAV